MDDMAQGGVWLPLGFKESLWVQGFMGPSGGEPVVAKDSSPERLSGALLRTMQQAALMVRASQTQQMVGPRSVRLCVKHVVPEGTSLGCPVNLLQAWSGAAAALADQLFRCGVSKWGEHTLLLAELDLQETQPERWGSLKPLHPDLENRVLQALAADSLHEHWKQATVVLAGGGSDQTALREALAQRLPDGRVLVVDTLAALQGPHDVVRRPGVGEAWFPVVGGSDTYLHRLQVAVWSWQPLQGEKPPIEVVETPLGEGTSSNQVQMIPEMLRAWREQEQPSQRLWRTVVSIPPDLKRVTGPSFQLALVVADRIARGREWPGQGRVLATGAVCMDINSRCKVLEVGDMYSKLQAFCAQAQPGDIVLLPKLSQWIAGVQALRRTQHSPFPMTEGLVSVVFVSHVLP